MDWRSLQPGDPALINKIVDEYMSQGKFDQLRRQLLSEVDTKPSYQNVKQRMESTVRTFLKKQEWRPDLNKNQLRDSLKRQILAAPFLRPGVGRIVEQLANRSSMIDLRPDLEVVTRGLLGIKDEAEEMDTLEVEAEPIDSPEDFKMVIATEEELIEEEIKPSMDEVAIPGEEKPYETMVDAMEDLNIPGEESSSQPGLIEQTPPSILKSEPVVEEPMAVDEASSQGIEAEDDLSGDESDHPIMNQMSPISAGTPSPPPSPSPSVDSALTPIKRASEFVGKIPKMKKDSEKDNSVVKEERTKREESSSQMPKNGVNDERKENRRDRSRDRDRKSTSDRSRDKDRKSNDKKSDSKDRDRRDRDRNEKSRTSDRDRSRRDGDRNRDRNSSRDKDRHRDETRDKHRESNSVRSKDRDRGKSKERNSTRSRDSEKDKHRESSSSRNRGSDRVNHSSRDRERSRGTEKDRSREDNPSRDRAASDSVQEESIPVQESNRDDVKTNTQSSEKESSEHIEPEPEDIGEVKDGEKSSDETPVKETNEEIAVENQDRQVEGSKDNSSSESVRNEDESSQDSAAVEPVKSVSEKRVFKISPMVTRSKGRRKVVEKSDNDGESPKSKKYPTRRRSKPGPKS